MTLLSIFCIPQISKEPACYDNYLKDNNNNNNTFICLVHTYAGIVREKKLRKEIEFISYLLSFSDRIDRMKTHTEIFSSNHSRESTFSHVGKGVSSNQKSAVRMNQSVRKRVHVVFGASSIFIHRSL